LRVEKKKKKGTGNCCEKGEKPKIGIKDGETYLFGQRKKRTLRGEKSLNGKKSKGKKWTRGSEDHFRTRELRVNNNHHPHPKQTMEKDVGKRERSIFESVR